MKLRVRGSSLRLRLTQGEVARIGAGERVEEVVTFGPSADARLVYAITTSNDALAVAASFSGSEVRIVIPAEVARRWATSADVGIEAEQANGSDTPLRILVEKDFECLAPRPGEDDSDAFPHPTKCG
ncbi:MAG: hypothetical protein JST00_34610 [Deltaproteobacteria bacterium]|nr:hypothetical protein [Deltaproteobacteria bacterium]